MEQPETIQRFPTFTGIPKNAPPAFHMLVKPTGAICNLDCKYCFFLSKEMLYPGSRFRMADELLEAYIQQLLESHTAPEVNIAWQGGEPTLMGLDFFKRSVEYAQKYKKPGQQILHTMQTNGTKIDEEIVLHDNDNIQIGDTVILFTFQDFKDRESALNHYKNVGEN